MTDRGSFVEGIGRVCIRTSFITNRSRYQRVGKPGDPGYSAGGLAGIVASAVPISASVSSRNR
jgi:hypothetical protein